MKDYHVDVLPDTTINVRTASRLPALRGWSVRGKQHGREGAPEEVSQPKCAVCFFLKTIQNIQKHITT